MALSEGFFPLGSTSVGTVIYRFKDLFRAVVLDRPNRFIVDASWEGGKIKCHLHDPGRLKELIFPGNSILVRRAAAARTMYRVTAALSGNRWILIDSGIHSRIASALLRDGFMREVPLSGRRIDFAWQIGGKKIYLEVKGCSLCIDSIALFPDAPTRRGTEQIKLLTDFALEGGKAFVLFLVFSEDAASFSPNAATDPDFANQLGSFVSAGGKVVTAKFGFREKELVYLGEVSLGRQWSG